jgi:uncharacterized repeat protein (TIGR02543 family)
MKRTRKMNQVCTILMAVMLTFYGKTVPVKAESVEVQEQEESFETEDEYSEEAAADKEYTVEADGAVTLYAQWISEAELEETGMSAYREECYFQQEDGSYAIEEPELLYAKTGDTVKASASADDYEHYHINYSRSVLSGQVTEPKIENGAVKFFTLKVYYDLDEVSLSYNLNQGIGAENVDYKDEMVKYGSFVVLKESPEREGYLFTGWSDGENLYEPGDSIYVKEDVTLKAKWVKKTELAEPVEAAYLVESFLQQADGTYIVKKSELLYGNVGKTVTAVPKKYAHYHRNKKLSEVSGKVVVPSVENGKQKLLVLKLYYDLDKVTVTYNLNKGTGSGYASQTVRYGEAVSMKKIPTRKGYVFTQWKSGGNKYKTGDNIKVTKNITLTAGWTKKVKTSKRVTKAEYFVERYLQQPDGTYVVKDSKICKGTVGEKVSVTAKNSDYQHYYVNKNKSVLSGKVSLPVQDKYKEKMLVLKVYYNLEKEEVSYDLNGGKNNGAEDLSKEIRYGDSLTLKKAPTKEGYVFLGWNDGNNIYEPGDSVKIKGNMVFTAEWEQEISKEEPTKAACLIEYCLQQPWTEGSSGEENVYVVEESKFSYGTIGETVTAKEKKYEYYHINKERSLMSGTVFLTESEEETEFLVLRVYYDLDEVVMGYEMNGGTKTENTDYEPEMVEYGSVVVVKENPVMEGYLFTGWSDGESLYEPGDPIALTEEMALTGQETEDEETMSEDDEDTTDDFDDSEEEYEIDVMLVGGVEEGDTEEETDDFEEEAEEDFDDFDDSDADDADDSDDSDEETEEEETEEGETDDSEEEM